jgi:hypothetical protein
MEQYTLVHDQTNASEHPLTGNANIYTARAESNGQYELSPETDFYTAPRTAVRSGNVIDDTVYGNTANGNTAANVVKIGSIMEYLSERQGQGSGTVTYNGGNTVTYNGNGGTATYNGGGGTANGTVPNAANNPATDPNYVFNEAASNYGDVTAYDGMTIPQ